MKENLIKKRTHLKPFKRINSRIKISHHSYIKKHKGDMSEGAMLRSMLDYYIINHK